MFITFEGIEGCGKSTQARLLADRLKVRGFDVLHAREPGGTPSGERIRELLLNSESAGMSPLAELFLYEACRAEIVEKIIRPALRFGKVVVLDRYIDSTVAYQRWGRGISPGVVARLNAVATGGLCPDVTILLDMDPEAGLERAFSRIKGRRAKSLKKEDRFELEGIEFHTRVRNGFLKIAAAEKRRVKVVDAVGEIESIHEKIYDIIKKAVLKRWKR